MTSRLGMEFTGLKFRSVTSRGPNANTLTYTACAVLILGR